MKIPRPRLFVASLVVAAVVIGGFVWFASSSDSGNGEVDAVLSDPQEVDAFPTDGLANDDVQGEPFPDAVFLDRDGNEITSESLLGEPLVVNLWFSSCAPCAKELPAFAAVDADGRRRAVHRCQHDRLGGGHGALRRRTRREVRAPA